MKIEWVLAVKYNLRNKLRTSIILNGMSIILTIGIIFMTLSTKTQSEKIIYQIISMIIIVFLGIPLINIYIAKDIKTFRLFYLIGIEPVITKHILMFSITSILIISIPSALLLTFLITLINSTFQIGLNNIHNIQVMKLLPNLFICLLIILIAIRISINNAIDLSLNSLSNNFNKSDKYFKKIKISILKSKKLFPIIFGIRNSLKNINFFWGVLLASIIITMIFINMTMKIELSWKIGNHRKPYPSDFAIKIPVTNQNNSPNHYLKEIDNDFQKRIKLIDNIKDVFYQYSIIDRTHADNPEQFNEGIYDYYLILPDKVITKEASNLFNLTCPTKRDGYPSNLNFVFSGLSGYDENMLKICNNYLEYGKINIDDMKNNPIILLPKYINEFENVDINYSNLRVGDNITLAEVDLKNSDYFYVNKKIDLIVGGFLNTLPFNQLNGASSGLMVIMHPNQLKELSTNYIYIMEVYVKVDNGWSESNLNSLQKLCNEYQYILTEQNIPTDTLYKDTQAEYELIVYSLFSVLGVVLLIFIIDFMISNFILRRNEFIFLIAIGMSKLQIILFFISEILFPNLLGYTIGVMLGMLLILSGDLRSVILTTAGIMPIVHICICFVFILLVCMTSTLIGIMFISEKNLSTTLKESDM